MSLGSITAYLASDTVYFSANARIVFNQGQKLPAIAQEVTTRSDFAEDGAGRQIIVSCHVIIPRFQAPPTHIRVTQTFVRGQVIALALDGEQI